MYCTMSFTHFLPYMASFVSIFLSHTRTFNTKNHVGHCRKSEKSLQVINFYSGRTNIAGQKVSAKKQIKSQKPESKKKFRL